MIVHMYIAPIYEYGGWLFEVNKMTGAWPLLRHTAHGRKKCDPRLCAPDRFWDVYERFAALPKEEQAKFCVEPGGRVKF